MDGFTLHLLLLLLPLSATFGFYVLSRRPAPRRTAALPPSPLGLPIIGHLHLLSDKPHCSMAELARKLGPIIYLQLGRVGTVVISSAQLAELVLKTHDHVFANRPQLVAAQYLSFGCSDVTFSPYGAYWRQARKICVTELLSSKRVSSFELVREEEVTRLVSAVSDRTGSEVNMSELFFKLSNDMLCRVAFGKRFMEQSGDLAAVLTETQALLAGFCWGDFFPGWGWVNWASGMKRRLEKNLEDLRTVGHDIIREHLRKREGAGPPGDGKEDFVDVLLRVQRRGDLEVPFTDDNLKALVLDMFVAGTDTTSSTLEWTMTQLVRHPTILKKAQEEVRKTAAAAGTRTVEEVDLRHLRYLKAVIKETMRLNPPVPLLVPRESMENCNLGGYEVVAGTRVLINTYAMGRDPGTWENPLEFRPERFDDADFRGQDFRFLPFGGGRRGCPGFGFGMATVEMALARILYHFDWELGPGVEAKDLDMEEIFGLATRKKSALVLVPKRIH